MNEIENEDVIVQDELTALKERATLMGLKFHPSISLDKLREKVNTATDESDGPDSEDVSAKVVAPVIEETVNQKHNRLKKEALALVRIRLTCMNPAKAEWEGEIFTVGTAVVGTIKKYVPFNADEGWHVPRFILDQIKARECQVFVTVKGPRGNTTRQGKLIKEFAVEILDPLTEEELHDLAQRQAMANSIG